MLTIKPQDISALIEAFERSASQEMRVAAGNFELQLSKSAAGFHQIVRSRSDASRPVTSERVSAAPAFTPPPAAQEPVAHAATHKPAAAGALPPGHVYIKAANLGTFYRSPKPGAPSYVEVGTKVVEDTEICLIEVMKLFTPLVAGVTGVIREVLVKDGALVEFDQPLFLVQVEA